MPGRVLNGPLEAEAGRQETGEIRMFNHWAAGLRSGLLPEVCVATAKDTNKKTHFDKFAQFPKQRFHCRGSGGFVRELVQVIHSRLAGVASKKRGKEIAFWTRLSKNFRTAKVFATGGR